MSKKNASSINAPVLGPQTQADWAEQTLLAMHQTKEASLELREEYRRLLAVRPDIADEYGIPALALRAALKAYKGHALFGESITFTLNTMRAQLAGANASKLELLLVDVILGCYADYWQLVLVYEQKKSEYGLNGMEQWDRVLAAKEARYLRAIETLARVRRLLKLTVQINVATPGSQQINVGGDVTA